MFFLAWDDATKERIRHRIWARVNDLEVGPFPPSYDAYVYPLIAGLVGGPVAAIALAIFRSSGHPVVSRLGAATIALLICIGAVLLTSDSGGRIILRFSWNDHCHGRIYPH